MKNSRKPKQQWIFQGVFSKLRDQKEGVLVQNRSGEGGKIAHGPHFSIAEKAEEGQVQLHRFIGTESVD